MNRYNGSILVVDANEAEGRSLAQDLKKRGLSAFTARDCYHAMSILEFRAFEVLIIDTAASEADGVDLIGWASCACPRPRIIAMGKASSPDEERSMIARGVGLCLPKPVNVEGLVRFLDATRSRSFFSGYVQGVDLVDYVQFMMLTGNKTVLEITSNVGTQGRIFIAGGQLVHAECGILKGEQALYGCLCFKEGGFKHLPWYEPERVTVDKPGEYLLMEAVRKRDDAWGIVGEEGGNGSSPDSD